MNQQYIAAIHIHNSRRIKGIGFVDITSLRTLSAQTSAKFKELEREDQILRVTKIPQIPQSSINIFGFQITYSTRTKGLRDNVVYQIPIIWSGEKIAQECLNILKADGLEEDQIQLIGFAQELRSI